MNQRDFSSAGGKAMKGTPQAKERARKGGLAAAAKRKLEGETLADRSAYVASKEAQGKARMVSTRNAVEDAIDASKDPDATWEPIIEYDTRKKWTPTPDLE